MTTISTLELLSNEVKNTSDLEYMLSLAFKLFNKPNGCDTEREYRYIIQPWLQNPSYGSVMAYEHDVPVGFCLHARILPKEKDFYKDLAEMNHGLSYSEKSSVIHMIAVDERHRHEGIGIALTNRMLDDVRENDVDQVYALCWKGKAGESFHLFQKLGFRELVRIRECYADNSEGILVVKEL
jgi:ribosomal protein S18 acetylase RimI-like enzyme